MPLKPKEITIPADPELIITVASLKDKFTRELKNVVGQALNKAQMNPLEWSFDVNRYIWVQRNGVQNNQSQSAPKGNNKQITQRPLKKNTAQTKVKKG